MMATRAYVLLTAGVLLWSGGCSEKPSPPDTAGNSPTAVDPTTDTGSVPATATAEALPTNPPASTTAAPKASDDPARESFRRLTTRGISVEEWEAAHQELIDLGPAAAAALQEGLQSNDPIAQEWAAMILALNPEAALAARQELKACLAAESGYLRANAAAALSLVPGEEDQVLPTLMELARSTDPELRRMAAVNLGNLGAAAASHVTELQPLLADKDPEVVRPIVELLGRLGASAAPALPQLQQIAFEQTDSDLKSAAELAVEQVQAANGPQVPLQ